MDEQFLNFIKQQAESHIELASRREKDEAKAKDQINLIRKYEEIFLGKALLDDSDISLLKRGEYYYSQRYFETVFNYQWSGKDSWPISNPIIQKIIWREHVTNVHNSLSLLNKRYIAGKFTLDPELDIDAFIQFLNKHDFKEVEIIYLVFQYSSRALFMQTNGDDKAEQKLTRFGEYLFRLIQPGKSFWGMKKDTNYKQIVDAILIEKSYNNSEKIFEWMLFLYVYYPGMLNDCYYQYLFYSDYQKKKLVNLTCVNFLIENEAGKLDGILIKAMQEVPVERGVKFGIYLALNQKLNGKYHDMIIEMGEDYLVNSFKKITGGHVYYYDVSTSNGPLSIVYSKYLIACHKEKGKERIEKFLKEADFIYPHYLKFLDEQYGYGCLPYLIDALFKDSEKSDYFTTIFSILNKYDFRPYLTRIIEFITQVASGKTREQAAVLLAKYPDDIMPVATNLVTEKTVNQRIAGALILSEVNTEKANIILSEAVDLEINDDTRDIMLEALAEKRFAQPYTLKMVKDMIAKAEARKKLSRWNEKWMEEEKLPRLYWSDGKKELSITEVRYLLYRMKRAQGLNSDIEAKQLLHHIDRDLSNKFAKAMLVAFQDSNSDPKLKYYLTIAGLLGDDDIMHSLNTLFKKNITDKRVKMAEYVIGALAMVGTNKALRLVEVIYRKFANKKPAISSAAKEALTAAANELNISMDELADRIIPNFDFDGLYRKFEVDGEEYRAFINSEFTLSFLNEDNKVRKSIPANTPKELKAEFKEIEKEVRDIVKSQSGRLEKYMLEERRWPVNDWQNFFFMNPVMFVYALKLVWGVFDKDNNLLDVFYCSEDTSLYDVNDEEVMLNEDQFIGIIHPVYLSPEKLKLWYDKVYNMQLITIFPQFERSIIAVEESEKEQSYSKMFYGKGVPKGADFVNTFMVKKNWIKSTGDGGYSEFTKWYRDEIRAYANIEGP
ncbi:MAG TPA: DUF4132 domain-containing protein, partial [Bacteroidales bacterium]